MFSLVDCQSDCICWSLCHATAQLKVYPRLMLWTIIGEKYATFLDPNIQGAVKLFRLLTTRKLLLVKFMWLSIWIKSTEPSFYAIQLWISSFFFPLIYILKKWNRGWILCPTIFTCLICIKEIWLIFAERVEWV